MCVCVWERERERGKETAPERPLQFSSRWSLDKVNFKRETFHGGRGAFFLEEEGEWERELFWSAHAVVLLSCERVVPHRPYTIKTAFFSLQRVMYLSIACPRVPPPLPPPPPPPGRWWAFDQGGWSNLSENPTLGTNEMVKQPHPGAGSVRYVCMTWFIESGREHAQITVQTDGGQCAPPPEPTSWSNFPPLGKANPGACNWQMHYNAWKMLTERGELSWKLSAANLFLISLIVCWNNCKLETLPCLFFEGEKVNSNMYMCIWKLEFIFSWLFFFFFFYACLCNKLRLTNEDT